jgi:protein-S-isoprenylcysteine O-methyltransferase Ste14
MKTAGLHEIFATGAKARAMADYAYGLWGLVIFDSVLTIAFAASFFWPRSKHDWRAFGGFSGFIVALFTEMYGYPLTVYLLAGPLAGVVPGVNFSHGGGHLWNDVVGWKGDPHLSPFHVASYLVIVAGFSLVYAAWRVLYVAKKRGELATAGPYAYVRHPQYLGFILVMAGFLLQWPTFVTLAMFPVLLVVYRRLAAREESDVRAEFKEAFDAWATTTPPFWPHWRSLRHAGTPAWLLGPRLALARLGTLTNKTTTPAAFSARHEASRSPSRDLRTGSRHSGHGRKEPQVLRSPMERSSGAGAPGQAREVPVRVKGGHGPAVAPLRAEP